MFKLSELMYKSPKTGLQGASETVIKLLNDNNIPYVFEEF